MIWRIAHAHGLLTGPDFIVTQCGSRAPGIWVSLVSVVFVVPYMTLQLSGIQVLLCIAGYDAFDSTVAVGAAFVLIIFFVFACGCAGSPGPAQSKTCWYSAGV